MFLLKLIAIKNEDLTEKKPTVHPEISGELPEIDSSVTVDDSEEFISDSDDAYGASDIGTMPMLWSFFVDFLEDYHTLKTEYPKTLLELPRRIRKLGPRLEELSIALKSVIAVIQNKRADINSTIEKAREIRRRIKELDIEPSEADFISEEELSALEIEFGMDSDLEESIVSDVSSPSIDAELEKLIAELAFENDELDELMDIFSKKFDSDDEELCVLLTDFRQASAIIIGAVVLEMEKLKDVAIIQKAGKGNSKNLNGLSNKVDAKHDELMLAINIQLIATAISDSRNLLLTTDTSYGMLEGIKDEVAIGVSILRGLKSYLDVLDSN
jgi:hypothetical protein